MQSSWPIAQDLPRGVRDTRTGVISTGTESIMITEPIAMIVIECLRLLQGVGHTCLGNMTTDVLTVVGEGFQSTPGNRALMRDLFSFRVWSTETELKEKATTEIFQPAAECMSQVQSASAEPSGLW